MTGCAVRVGTLIYWMGCAGAVVMAGLALFGLVSGSGTDRLWSSAFLAAGAGGAWFTGAAARWLATRSQRHGVRHPPG